MYNIRNIIVFLQDSINKFSIGITSWYETYKDGNTRYYYNRKVRRRDIEQRIGMFNIFEDDPNIFKLWRRIFTCSRTIN